MSDFPKELKYSKEHEWVKEVDGKYLVGITEYAAEQLGDIVHVELPEQDAEFGMGETFGVVESVKSVSDVYMPLAGKIVEINSLLADNPGVMNEEPYGEGWMVKVDATELDDLEQLMSADAYKSFLAEEH